MVTQPLDQPQPSESFYSHHKALNTISLVYFSVGILLAVILTAGMAAADYEASAFDVITASRGESRFSPLDFACPVAITAADHSHVRVRLANTTDRARQFTVRAAISDGFLTLMTHDQQRVPLAAGESRSLQWPVTPDDAAWGRIILVRIFVARNFDMPARTDSCGILYLNVPFVSGGTLIGVYLAVTLLCIASGLAGWMFLNRPLLRDRLRGAQGMITLTLTVLAGLMLSLLGQWLPGGAFLTVSLLLAMSVGSWALDLSRPPRPDEVQ